MGLGHALPDWPSLFGPAWPGHNLAGLMGCAVAVSLAGLQIKQWPEWST